MIRIRDRPLRSRGLGILGVVDSWRSLVIDVTGQRYFFLGGVDYEA
jgi:hypothetical protein